MRPDTFTSGPWSAAKVKNEDRIQIRAPEPDSGTWPVAEVSGRDRETDIANARLIAAAPDLLASLTDAAIRCAGLHGGKFREHRCVICTKWLDVIAKAVAP